MDLQPNRAGRRRRRKRKKQQATPLPVEPVIVAARRPNSPRLEKPTRRQKAASAKPRPVREESDVVEAKPKRKDVSVRRREARIVQTRVDEVDERERERRRLLSQLMASEGRSAVSRAAENYLQAGFTIPDEQDVHVKLLEHFDEARARESIAVLAQLILREAPCQSPVFDQRLRRLEEHADESTTREAAAELRRALRA